MKTFKVCLALICVAMVAMVASVSSAQVPGDGIPDVYYFVDGSPAPSGLALPAGWLTIDTDGSDMVTVLIGSDVDVTSAPTDGVSPGCDLCDNGFLPDPNAPPFLVSAWTAGTIAGSNQWVRTSPLNTLGYQGVVGQDEDPGNIFPSTGLAFYGSDVNFDKVFVDDNGEMASVTFATLDNGTIFTDVTLVQIPEPATFGLIGVALLGLLGLRRR